MRLIDADKLIDYFYFGIDDKPIIDGISDRKIIDIIKNHPTAYSVAKVVEKLEEAECNVMANMLFDNIIKEKPKELGQLIAYDKAIEIVKQGGVDDDVCEWEKGSSGYVGYPAYYSKCCTTNSKGLEMQAHIIANWKYCPYCGKKIKIVGD